MMVRQASTDGWARAFLLGSRLRPAFTLVETLLALAIVAVLMGSMFAFLSNVMARSQQTRAAIRVQKGIDVFYADVERSLATTFVGDRKEAAGVQGGSSSLVIRSRGTIADAGSLLDLRGSEYRFRNGVIEGRRWGGPEASGDPDEEWAALANGVESLRLRYFDGRAWTSEFSSFEASRLPRAVEIAVWMGELAPAESSDGAAPTEQTTRAPDRVTTIAIPDAGGGA